MYYIIETRYVGENPDQHIDADSVEIRTTPADPSNLSRTTKDLALYAHGEYETIEAAKAAISAIFGDVLAVDSDDPDVVLLYRNIWKYIQTKNGCLNCRVSYFTQNHNGKNGNVQVFKSIRIISPITADTNTFDGFYFSDLMLFSDGTLFVPVDDSEVEYSAEYEGEDISLIPMTHILLPAVDEANMPLAKDMAEILRNEISSLFGSECDLPIVEFDYLE